MAGGNDKHSFCAFFSLDPLMDFWRDKLVPVCDDMASMFASFEQQIKNVPELQGDVKDISLIEKHRDLIIPLMSVVFPPASWETDIVGALTPYTSQSIYVSPRFEDLLLDDHGHLRGEIKDDEGFSEGARLLRAYFLILDKVYGIRQGIETPVIRIIPDRDTGLDRYYRVTPDVRFVQVRPVGEPRTLSDEDRTVIMENLSDPEVLAQFIPADQFEFRGFTAIHAIDVTKSEVISALEKDLIDQVSIFSLEGFRRIQERLRILLGRPDIHADMGALLRDQVLIIDDGCKSSANCIFTNSKHIPVDEISDSAWMRAAEKQAILRITDLRSEKNLTPTEEHLVDMGARSMIISPLYYQGEIIGTLDLVSPNPNDLTPMDVMVVKEITPIFSMALKRGLDEMNHEVQSVIKEKCTAVHPSVEWRFQRAALKHMDRLRNGEPSDMEPIIFRSVIPFYGQSDIRGSSEARNISIQEDLIEQLTLAYDVMKWAGKARSWPLIKEFEYRIEKRIREVRSGLTSEDELSIALFLSSEVEPAFAELAEIGLNVSRTIEVYKKALDPVTGVIYRKRREFEESVSRLNAALSAYLDKEEVEAQSIFPHYFEKHQTDGVDYIIYAGSSMKEEGELSDFHKKNLFLWQIITACGMALQTEKIKTELRVPLDTCHLILVNHTPISIRFRYDEKRFDVDGAYDVRHEIVKSRIDKAIIKGSSERLTQPGRIAIVYSNPEEEKEALRHIEFLQAHKKLLKDLEALELENMPDVRGLKALRIGVNLEAKESELLREIDSSNHKLIGKAV